MSIPAVSRLPLLALRGTALSVAVMFQVVTGQNGGPVLNLQTVNQRSCPFCQMIGD